MDAYESHLTQQTKSTEDQRHPIRPGLIYCQSPNKSGLYVFRSALDAADWNVRNAGSIVDNSRVDPEIIADDLATLAEDPHAFD